MTKKKGISYESGFNAKAANSENTNGKRHGLAAGNSTRKRTQREIWAVDCETDPFKKRRIPLPFIWGAYNGTEYHQFDTFDGVADFFFHRRCLVYAHNGGRFDWHYGLYRIEPYTPVLVIAGRLAKFKIGDAEYRDSYNLLPMPLRSGGAKFEIDYGILELAERDKPANRLLIEERLRTDCVYLFQMLEKFIGDYGLHLTFPSASMHAWSKLSGIEKPETNSAFYQLFEPYYMGGRVECFESGIIERPMKLYDINSAYSAAMMLNHPWGEIPSESTTLPDRREAIERCFITIEQAHSCGAFPFRSDSRGISFPHDGDTRVFHITGWEYLAALETGALGSHRIERVLQLPTAINFVRYMDNFYHIKVAAKRASDTFAYECAKRFLCSLYGKFGSNPDNYFEYQLIPPRYLDAAFEADGFMFCAEVGNLALVARPLPEHKGRYYNVAVAASITGCVRSTLYRAIRNARGVVYCDTDCILAADFPGIAPDPELLGAWKLESNIEYAAIAGKKLYALRDTEGKYKTASKGVKLTAAEIIRIAQGEIVEYEPEVPQYSFKRGVHFVPRKIRKTA